MSRASILLLLALGLLALFACDADALRPRGRNIRGKAVGAVGNVDPAGEPIPSEAEIQQTVDETRARYSAKAAAVKAAAMAAGKNKPAAKK